MEADLDGVSDPSSLVLVLVKGPEYGVVDVLLGEKTIMPKVDCYASEVQPSVILRVPLDKAAAIGPLRIRVTGKNADATGYSLGLYCAGIVK